MEKISSALDSKVTQNGNGRGDTGIKDRTDLIRLFDDRRNAWKQDEMYFTPILSFIIRYAPCIAEKEDLTTEEARIATIREVMRRFSFSEQKASAYYEFLLSGKAGNWVLREYKKLYASGELDFTKLRVYFEDPILILQYIFMTGTRRLDYLMPWPTDGYRQIYPNPLTDLSPSDEVIF